MIGIAAVVVGIVLGLVFHPSVPEVIQPYLPIAVVAALDAVFGGLRAYLERIFDSKVFVVSFVFNVLVAALIVYVGDQLGVGTQLWCSASASSAMRPLCGADCSVHERPKTSASEDRSEERARTGASGSRDIGHE
jgi:small basic protein